MHHVPNFSEIEQYVSQPASLSAVVLRAVWTERHQTTGSS